MNTLRITKLAVQRLSVVSVLALPFAVHADGAPENVQYDRARGELSPGTQAPSIATLMGAIDDASPTGLTTMLEYGERVECLECIPKLESKLLKSSSPEVREIAAWWLRHRPFGYARSAVKMRHTLADDQDAVVRVRAAEALGEFMDPGGVPALEQAVTGDDSVEVRLASVRALGRLNARSGHAAIIAAFDDEDPTVRRAALDQVQRVAFFQDREAVVAKLDDSDANVRIRAAQVVGDLRTESGREGLEEILANDHSIPARQAAAWALGRIGGSRDALTGAQESERNERVLDSIRVALRMVR